MEQMPLQKGDRVKIDGIAIGVVEDGPDSNGDYLIRHHPSTRSLFALNYMNGKKLRRYVREDHPMRVYEEVCPVCHGNGCVVPEIICPHCLGDGSVQRVVYGRHERRLEMVLLTIVLPFLIVVLALTVSRVVNEQDVHSPSPSAAS
jgi:hypothetical protein